MSAYDRDVALWPNDMTLRDYFAIRTTDAEEAYYKTLSPRALEALVGSERPSEPKIESDRIAWQIAAFKWDCMATAVLRYHMADAMLAAREAK